MGDMRGGVLCVLCVLCLLCVCVCIVCCPAMYKNIATGCVGHTAPI